MIVIFFILLILLIINSYFLYPLIIYFFSFIYRYKPLYSTEVKSLSILISAYNEEKVIEKRIRNILEQNYDLNKIEILVGSDNSNDKTNEILSRLEKEIPQLRTFLFDYRQGKAGVLNFLSEKASNEILVFTDANTEFNGNALKNLVKHFENNEVGGVSGKLILIDDEEKLRKGIEEKSYWEYETFIKTSEGKLGILIGANGGIFAIKKNLFEKIPIDKPVTDDFFISLNIVKKGFKFLYELDAIAYEEIPKSIKTEFQRKVRFAATNFQTISFFKSLLFNKNILISYAFWSHKIIRWFLPLILILLFVLNIILLNYHYAFKYLLYLQLIFYCVGLLNYFLNKLNVRIPILSLLTYFFITNFALLIGLIRFLRKKHSVIWQSTPR
ncbi:MAG: glycosyltransferase family 2 protein [Ignavibacteria bacterium]